MVLSSLYRLIRGAIGSFFLKRIVSLTKNEIGLFCVYGLGDTYLTCLLLPALKKRFPNCRFVLIIPKYHQDVVKYFRHYFNRVIIFDHPYAKSFFPFLSSLSSQSIFYSHPSVYFWGSSLKILGYKNITILDLYRFILGVKSNDLLGVPHTSREICKSAQNRCKQLSLPQAKTVILVPESGVTTPISQDVWIPLGVWLQKQRLSVVVMSRDQKKYPFPTIFFPLEEAIPIIEYCGFLIATRSGFCDVISSAKAKMFFLYPGDHEQRSTTFDIYSFKSMGVPTEANEFIINNSNNTASLKKAFVKAMSHRPSSRITRI
ncbi:MAG: glycosyltransferase family 9 protein [Candidatus Pacebacteria bacterium]|nr:glycosyltransferase family 9 protein [Candidatus Paceibacterota bacterium]